VLFVKTLLTSILPAVALVIGIQTASSDTFGTSGNEFTIDFVDIGNTNHLPDYTAYGGAVPYPYRLAKYEISQNAIEKATASGVLNLTAGAWTGSQPAANISWYEAAAFVNWMNTSTGKTAAYDLSWSGTAWSMNLWSSAQAWTAGGENLYRNKDACYFLPSENEWYKAAYYNPAGANYFEYPTGSNSPPTAVASGTEARTAVYGQPSAQEPASVTNAGGLSPYGTMSQGGNVWEWNESAYARPNDSSSEDRALRGGFWDNTELALRSSYRTYFDPLGEDIYIGFRVASVDVVPEPSTCALLALGAGVLIWARRRQLHP